MPSWLHRTDPLGSPCPWQPGLSDLNNNGTRAAVAKGDNKLLSSLAWWHPPSLLNHK